MNRFVAHPKATAAQKALRKRLSAREGGMLIPIVGVAGVGKSTLRRRGFREFFAQPEWFKGGKWPVIELYAGLPDKAFYSSKAIARRSGAQLLNPALKWLEPMEGESREFYERIAVEHAAARTQLQGLSRKTSVTESDYWESFADCAQHRGMQVLSVEHCNSMLVNRRGTEPIQHCQHLMTLAEETDFTIVLTGTPDSVSIWEGLPELYRRVKPVWVENYSCTTEEECREVADVMRTIAGDIRTKPKNLLDRIGFEIVYASGGSFDLLEECFACARENAGESDRTVVTHNDFEDAYPDEKTVTALHASIECFHEARKRIASKELRKRAGKAYSALVGGAG